MKRGRKIILAIGTGLLVICLVGSCLSALSNQTLPAPPAVTDRLDELDKARLAETIHLKQTLGDDVWPGWGTALIPVLVWNSDTSFLIDYPEVPAGWEVVPGDDFWGKPYFRQPSVDPQNFAVLVDGRWSASMATKWETDNFLIEQFQNNLPPPLNVIFPYRFFIMPSEVQMTGLLHEAFHVFQSETAPGKLAAAEAVYVYEDAYFQQDATMTEAWREEIQLLIAALEAADEAESLALVSDFLEQRDRRRTAVDLNDDLIAYERLLEWEEGLAKYVEMTIWQTAAQTTGYSPLSEMKNDSDFQEYTTFDRRWSQEMETMKNLADDGSLVRFYYTGMVQAMLLDRHYPGWKDAIMADDVWLEMLLGEMLTE